MVHWMLEEAAAPYRIVPIDFEKGEHKTPSFLALNPMGKLPTIAPRRRGDRDGGDHRLHRRHRFPRPASHHLPGEAARRLLPMVVLRRRLLLSRRCSTA